MMKTDATIVFRDLEADDEVVVIVKHDDKSVGLTVSLKKNGDIEVFMDKGDARLVLDGLRKACE